MTKKGKAKAGNKWLPRAGFSEPASSEKRATPQSGVDDSVGTTGSQEAVPMNNASKGTSNASTPKDAEKLNASVATNSSKNALPTEAQAMGTPVGGSMSGADVLNVSFNDTDSKQGLQTEVGVKETARQQSEKKEGETTWAEPVGSSVQDTHDKAGKLDISVAVTDPKEILPIPAAALGTSVESAPKEIDEHSISVSAKDLQHAHHDAMDTSFESVTKQGDHPGVSVSHSVSTNDPRDVLPTQNETTGISVDSVQEETRNFIARVSGSEFKQGAPTQDGGALTDADGLTEHVEQELSSVIAAHCQQSTCGLAAEGDTGSAPEVPGTGSAPEVPKHSAIIPVTASPCEDFESSHPHRVGFQHIGSEYLDSCSASSLQEATRVQQSCQASSNIDAGVPTDDKHRLHDNLRSCEMQREQLKPNGGSRAIHPGDYTWKSQETQSEGFLRLRPNGQWWHAVHRHAKERARIVDPQHRQSNQPAPPVDIRRAYEEHTDKPDVDALNELRGTYKEFEVWELAECLGSWQEVLIPGTTGDASQDGQVPQRTHGVLLLCEHCGWKDNFPNAPLSRHPDKEEKEEVHEMVSSGSIKLCYALRSNLPDGDACLEFLMTSGDVCDAGGLSVTETQRCAHTRNKQVAFQALGFGRKYTQQSKLEAQAAE